MAIPKQSWSSARIARRDFLKMGGVALTGSVVSRLPLRGADVATPVAPFLPEPTNGAFPWKEFHLRLTNGEADFGGKKGPAILINGSTPGPEIRLREGDVFRAVVENALTEPTTVHWHGLLVPNMEDGVPGVTQAPIDPGRSLVYEFPIAQSGTYWYHSHYELQEQIGLAGPIIIEPQEPQAGYDSDSTLFFEDRVTVPPMEILNALQGKPSSDAARQFLSGHSGMMGGMGAMGDGEGMAGMAMNGTQGGMAAMMNGTTGGMFMTDIFYPFFTINGAMPPKPFIVRAKPGERVRLRFINAGASTYFRVQLDGHTLGLVAKDGNDVLPLSVDNFVIASAERYDFIVTAGAAGAYRLAASAMGQGSGAVAWLLVGDADIPKDASYAEPSWGTRPLVYAQLRARQVTILPPGAPIKQIRLTLGGVMMGYKWNIGGQYYPDADPLLIHEGDIVRVELVNSTMMAHPMHLHGHFFRLLDPAGDPPADAPLMDTVSVPPGGTTTIEFFANNPGAWIFHCHILYHHMTGMARVFRYEV